MSVNHVTNPQSLKRRIVYLLRFVSAPLLLFAAGVAVLAVLGIAQRTGWISAGGGSTVATGASAASNVDYICPMMCTPPQKGPGRCPVCAMELVPASHGGSGGDERSVVVDAATRRVVNIQTAVAEQLPAHRTVRAVGEIGYDEGRMKTISAYTPGRFDKMYVDYVGAVVEKGDRLAEFYSPDLYSAQVEYLQAKDAATRSGTVAVIQRANQRLLDNARHRLLELGMSQQQIELVSQKQQAQNRLDVVAPIHGTVVERLAVEGEYVKAGQPVFRLADLSKVWLLLELFPEDAASVRLGQAVTAQLKSMPNESIQGRIAFIDPEVNKRSRTVTVRVILANPRGRIRIGDYAKASIEVPIHSHGRRLVRETQPANAAIVVPRSAVLSAADQSVVYVEAEPGRFEIRRVLTGPTVGQNIVITKGLAAGETVASAGNFLLDSQMQLAGNPSLIDPSRATKPLEMIAGFSFVELSELQQLNDDEHSLAIQQVICPVSEQKLGSMGVPPKVEVDGRTIFICCEGCRDGLLKQTDVHLAKLESHRSQADKEAAQPPATAASAGAHTQ